MLAQARSERVERAAAARLAERGCESRALLKRRRALAAVAAFEHAHHGERADVLARDEQLARERAEVNRVEVTELAQVVLVRVEP